MAQAQTISTGYRPRSLQEILHRSLQRFNVLVCHRRFGKTVFTINETIDKGLRNPLKNPRYAYVAPFYGQAKRVAWDYFKDFTKNIPGVSVNEADLRIDIPRPHLDDKVRFSLLGADNPKAIRGIYLDGAVLDEFADMDPTVWSQVIRPALSDRLGWAIFIGTPSGRNHFYKLYHAAKEEPDWFTAMYKASNTGIIPESELKAAKITMTEEEYEQEFECSFTAALIGSYYGKYMETAEKEGRITSVPYDPAVPVDTFWDLGIGDELAIWFCQQVGQEIHLIDYMEEGGRGLEWWVQQLRSKPYIYRDINLPHDANARELGTGKARVETLRGYWPGQRISVLPKWGFDDGVHAVRMILGRCWFDSKKCDRGILALENYQKKWDSKLEVFSDKPLHDWSSHGSDAFRYLAMGYMPENRRISRQDLPRQAVTEYDIFGNEQERDERFRGWRF